MIISPVGAGESGSALKPSPRGCYGTPFHSPCPCGRRARGSFRLAGPPVAAGWGEARRASADVEQRHSPTACRPEPVRGSPEDGALVAAASGGAGGAAAGGGRDVGPEGQTVTGPARVGRMAGADGSGFGWFLAPRQSSSAGGDSARPVSG